MVSVTSVGADLLSPAVLFSWQLLQKDRTWQEEDVYRTDEEKTAGWTLNL